MEPDSSVVVREYDRLAPSYDRRWSRYIRAATDLSIRERDSLKELYGGRRWRKLKGIALVRLGGGDVRKAEVHW